MQDARAEGPLERVTIDTDMSYNPAAVEELIADLQRGDSTLLVEIVRQHWPYDFPYPKAAKVEAFFHETKPYHVRFVVSEFTVPPRGSSTLH